MQNKILDQLQPYQNLTDSVQTTDVQALEMYGSNLSGKTPSKILLELQSQKQIQQQNQQITYQIQELQQVKEENKQLKDEVIKYKSALSEYERLKEQLLKQINSFSNYEEELKSKYQKQLDKQYKGQQQQFDNLLFSIIQKLKQYCDRDQKEHETIPDYIEYCISKYKQEQENYQQENKKLLSQDGQYQLQIQHLQKQLEKYTANINEDNNHTQTQNQQNIQSTDQQETAKSFNVYMNYSLKLLATQVNSLQFEKLILKQINYQQYNQIQDINTFLNVKQKRTTKQKLKTIKLAIFFMIHLKRNVSKQVVKSFNSKFFLPSVLNLKKTLTYKQPSSELQFEQTLNANCENILNFQQSKTLINFKKTTIYQDLNVKFNMQQDSNNQLQSQLNVVLQERQQLQQQADKAGKLYLNLQMQLKELQNHVPLEKFTQVLTENELLNKKMIEINQLYQEKQNQLQLISKECDQLKHINETNFQHVQDLVQLRGRYTSLIHQFNKLKCYFHDKLTQYGYSNEASELDIKFNLNDKQIIEDQNIRSEEINHNTTTNHVQQQQSKIQNEPSNQYNQVINQNDAEYKKFQESQEVQSLAELRNKYIQNSLYRYDNIDKADQNINSLNVGYDYLKSRTQLSNRIFELMDFK